MFRRLIKPRNTKTLNILKEAGVSMINEDQGSSDPQLSSDLHTNETVMKSAFSDCSDIVFRVVNTGDGSQLLLVYVDGLIDMHLVDEAFIKPMFSMSSAGSATERIHQQLFAIADLRKASLFKDVIQGILDANLAVFSDGAAEALLADVRGYEKRSVTEPSVENSIRGPRDSFTETLRTNTSLIRRRIKSSKLKMEQLHVGELTHTQVALTYIEGVASKTVVDEIRKRVERIQIDGVIGSGYIEDFVEEIAYSPFPQVQNSERPDVVCASLLEGRVAIIVDGTPFVLILPMTFWAGLQAAEDYYERSPYTSFIRWIRYGLLLVSLFLPSLYVALTTFHPQMVPMNLLISIAAAREGIPFPAVIEAFLMELMFEGLREAGIRLPAQVGTAVSIVGVLVIGQAAVDAGIVSAPMVIVVSATGIASFAIPRYNFGTAFRLLRFPLLFLAGSFGLFGIIVGGTCILIHLVGLHSVGLPYMNPVAPGVPQNLGDVLYRPPRWKLLFRPIIATGRNKQRMSKGQRPGSGES